MVFLLELERLAILLTANHIDWQVLIYQTPSQYTF